MGPSLPRARAFLLALAPALVLLALWEWFVRAFGVDPVFLPAPSRVAKAGFDSAGLLVVAARQTMLEAVLGLALAFAAGVLLGLAIDLSPVVRRTLYPLLVVSQTIPMIALAPLLVLWFGFGITPKLLVVALVCFFPIAVAVADGLGSAEPEMIRLVQSMGAGRRQLYLKVRVPQSLPYVFSGLKIAVTYGVIGAIFGEYVGGYEGLGILMQTAKNSFQTDVVFAAIFVTAVLSIGLFLMVSVAERLLLPWHARSAGPTETREPAQAGR